MSAPPRTSRGGGSSRTRTIGSTLTGNLGKGRGQNRERGGRANPSAVTLLQGMQSGTFNQRARPTQRDSGRSPKNVQATLASAHVEPSNGSSYLSSKASPVPSHRDYMNQMTAKFQQLKSKRETERTKAIKDGFLADPDKKTSLDKAITPVGTCTLMCPEFERVERIVQNMVDKTEKVINRETGRDAPAPERMIKRFRRSAAGYDEQLPSDIRTPETLQRTLNYLLDSVVGGEERLAVVHKFVWDRTRGIRNDFSIQQVTKEQDVRIAVDCFERIARFHVLSLHQLSKPENLAGEHFDAHQEREQLQNTLLSLIYYYDDNRGRPDFRHEAEFRAYCVILELQSQQPDLEDRMQSWSEHLLRDQLVRVAFKLYSAAGNTLYEQGPLKPQVAFDVAQGNAIGFWNLLRSKSVTYLMSCVAEIYFGQVRFIVLQALWKSVKRAPITMQNRMQDWTPQELTKFLGFDLPEQALEFCQQYGLSFKLNDAGDQYLDFTSLSDLTIDKLSTPNQQIFSTGIVEEKRCCRTLVAVINGIGVAQAIREGSVIREAESECSEVMDESERNEEDLLFFPESKQEGTRTHTDSAVTLLNPKAPTFQPAQSTSQSLAPFLGPVVGEPMNAIDIQNPFSRSNAISNTSSTPTKNSPAFSSLPLQSPTPPSSIAPLLTSGLVAPLPSGKPSFLSDAPSSFLTVPTPLRNNTPSKALSGTPDFDNAPSGFSLLRQAPPSQAFQTTNAQVFQARTHEFGVQVPSLHNPPSSPRPGFRWLPPPTNDLAASPLFPSTPPSNPPRSPILQKEHHSDRRDLTTEREAPAEGESIENRSNPSAAGVRTFQTIATDVHTDRGVNYRDPVTSDQKPLSGSLNRPTKKEIPLQVANVSPVSATKSAIPSTFTPNLSKAFSTSTDTKPKRKSPLGVQPPISAADSGPVSDTSCSKAAHNVAVVAFLEPHGILQQYVEHIAAPLVENTLRQFEREQPLRDAQIARQYLLSKKYLGRWRSTIWRRKVNRKAGNRRELLARSIRLESERKARGDADMQAIVEALKEKQHIQTEQLRQGLFQTSVGEGPVVVQAASSPAPTGQKRKSLHGDGVGFPMNETASRKLAKGHGHRRSKTWTNLTAITSKATSKLQAPAATSYLGSSIFSGQSTFMRDSTSSTLLNSASGRKRDSTRTDYFRLKALGIDPDTPLFPGTNSSPGRKNRQKESLFNSEGRKITNTTSTDAGNVEHRPGTPSQVEGTKSLVPSATSHDTSLILMPQSEDDADFLRQVREVRAAISQDAEWFKSQAAQMEQQHKKHNEGPESMTWTNTTKTASLEGSTSHSGLSRVNGYEFAPAQIDEASPHLLSRTEQRIRATGARGLATKPVGDYLAVAMSKSSKTALNGDMKPERTRVRNGKRRWGRINSNYVYQSDSHEEETPMQPETDFSRQVDQEWYPEKKMKHRLEVTPSNKGGRRQRSYGDGAYIYQSEESDEEVDLDAEGLGHRHRNGKSSQQNHVPYVSKAGLHVRGGGKGRRRELGLDSTHSHGPRYGETNIRNNVTREQVLIDPNNGHSQGKEAEERSQEGAHEEGEVEADEGIGDEGTEADQDEHGEEDSYNAEDNSVVSDDDDVSEDGISEGGWDADSVGPTLDEDGLDIPFGKAQDFHMRLRSASADLGQRFSLNDADGVTEMDRVAGGTGVSADDALVLSD